MPGLNHLIRITVDMMNSQAVFNTEDTGMVCADRMVTALTFLLLIHVVSSFLLCDSRKEKTGNSFGAWFWTSIIISWTFHKFPLFFPPRIQLVSFQNVV